VSKRGLVTTTRTILDEIYDAWRDHDLDRLASYLPDEFSHMIHIPQDVHPLGGMCHHGEKAALERLSLIFTQFDSLLLDPSEAVIDPDRAAVEIQIHCRHKETGRSLESVKTNFWTLEAGWPISLEEYYDIAGFRAFMSAVEATPPS
jgi:ketosteroid isomerase-like protein